MIDRYFNHTRGNGYFDIKRRRQTQYWMTETIDEALKNHFYRDPEIEVLLEEYRKKVINDEISSFVAANRLLDKYFNK